jgi:hypothetical protein
MGAVLDEVIGPDVIGVLGPEANTGPVRQPEAPLHAAIADRSACLMVPLGCHCLNKVSIHLTDPLPGKRFGYTHS